MPSKCCCSVQQLPLGSQCGCSPIRAGKVSWCFRGGHPQLQQSSFPEGNMWVRVLLQPFHKEICALIQTLGSILCFITNNLWITYTMNAHWSQTGIKQTHLGLSIIFSSAYTSPTAHHAVIRAPHATFPQHYISIEVHRLADTWPSLSFDLKSSEKNEGESYVLQITISDRY